MAVGLSLAQQLAELKAENEKLKNQINKVTEVTTSVGETGSFLVSGLKKGAPLAFTRAQFERLVGKSEAILSYMTANEAAAGKAKASYIPKERKPRALKVANS